MNLNAFPLEVQKQALTELIAERYKASLYATCKILLGMKDVNPETHGDMLKALESETKRKLMVMPRGTLKSSIGVVGYSIWLLLRNPNLRILIDSEVYTNSKNFLREIRSHLESAKLTDIFGTFKSDTNWSEGEITIKQRTQPYKESSITCGGIGTIKVGQHFDVIIGDDLNSNNNSQTAEGCKKVIDHYRLNISILEPNGIYLVIGTRYSQGDLIQYIIDQEIEYLGLLR